MDDNRLDRIRRRAHEIWEREGYPHGQHDEHWAQAEAEIDAEEAAGNTAPAEAVSADATPPTTGMPGMTEGTTRRTRTGDTTRGKDAKAPAKKPAASKPTASKPAGAKPAGKGTTRTRGKDAPA